MNVGSLFSGIGGMDAGLARAGHRHVFFCEADPWRREVLAARWPGVPVYDDVRTVGIEPTEGAQANGRCPIADGAGRLHTGAVPDLLCGGFPCQDLSVAGKRAGLDGARSGLFFEFARIIDAFRPGWVLLENVPGLLSSNGGRDFGIVLGTLADLGYGVGWRILDSRYFGVPQRRRRVFIVGALADGDPATAAGRSGDVLAVGSRCDWHPAKGSQERQRASGSPADSSRTGIAGPLMAMGGKNERGYRIGVEEASAGFIVPTVSPTLKATQAIGDPPDQVAFVVAAALTKGSTSGEGVNAPGRRQEDDVNIIAFRGDAMGVRRLTPTECERLQGLDDGWTLLGDRTPDSRRYSGLGDAVTATVAEWIGGRLADAA